MILALMVSSFNIVFANEVIKDVIILDTMKDTVEELEDDLKDVVDDTTTQGHQEDKNSLEDNLEADEDLEEILGGEIEGLEDILEGNEDHTRDIEEDLDEGIVEGIEEIEEDFPIHNNPEKNLEHPKIIITGYNFDDEELFEEVYDYGVVGEQRFYVPVMLEGYEINHVGADRHVYNGEFPLYNMVFKEISPEGIPIDVVIYIETTMIHLKVFYVEVEEEGIEDEVVEDVLEDDEEDYTTEKEVADGLEILKEEILNIPYTILKDSDIDFSKIIGIEDLEINIDTSKIGVQKVEIGTFDYDIEVIDLFKNDQALNNVPLDHWSKDYVLDVIEKGFIQGGTRGDLMLENTLTIADSFTAYDRLLLDKGLTEMVSSRDVVDVITKDIGDTWYSYTVRSVLSKYSKEELEKLELNNFERVITREEIAQILYNSLQGVLEENKEMIYYDDILETNNLKAIIFCTKAGLLKGDNNKVNPKGNLTRAEFMTILSRLDNLMNK